MTIRTISRTAAATAAFVVGASVYAQQVVAPAPQPAGDAHGELKEAKEKAKAEVDQKGGQRVYVEQKAIWALGDLPPKLMHMAVEKLAKEPDDARKAVLQASNIFQLQSALAQGTPEADRLRQAAEQLREVALGIEFKQVMTKDELKKPFANAALAAAAFYQQAAKLGYGKAEEEQTGYTLKGAAEYLTVAHVYAEQKPTAEVSRAAVDADRLGQQIIRLAKPTTIQAKTQNDPRHAPAGHELPDARTADPTQVNPPPQKERPELAALEQEAKQVIENLGKAIQQTTATAANWQGGGDGPRMMSDQPKGEHAPKRGH